MSIQSLQVFATTDGKQFTELATAEAHQTMLDNAEVLDLVSEAFVNTAPTPNTNEIGLIGRTRAFNKNVAVQTIAYVLSIGGTIPDDFQGVNPSEELQVRIDEEQAKVDAKTAEAKAKKAEANPEAAVEEVEASADLFK